MSSKCFLKPENSKEDSPDGKLSPGVLQWYLNFRTGRRRSSPPGVRGTVAKTGKLTLQMKTEKQRQQTQHKQSKISSEDRRGSTSSTGSSASSLPREVNGKRNGQPGADPRTKRQEQSKQRQDNRQHNQHSSGMGSPVSMNIGTVQFNTIQYSESQKSERTPGVLKKYPTARHVNEEQESDSSEFEDDFIEAFEEINTNKDRNKKQENQNHTARYALGLIQPAYNHHHFNSQVERRYK